MNLRLLILLVALVLGQWGCRSAATLQTADEVSFILLQLNDVYEIAPLEGGKSAGLARVATLRHELLRENPNTITVLAGDFLSPSFIGTLKMDNGQSVAGLQMVETLNTMGLDIATFGNHEFDLKTADLLQERIYQSGFSYTVCNAFRQTSEGPVAFEQGSEDRSMAVPKHLIREVYNAKGQRLRLGFIGVVLPFNQADYVAYTPAKETFVAEWEAIKPLTDLCIGITHLAIDEDKELAALTPGIPLFMGGHDHENMRHDVGPVRITKADANAKTVYIHRVTHNLKTRSTQIQSTLKAIDDSIADEALTKSVVDKWQARVDELMAKQGYNPTQQIYFAETPLQCTEAKVRTTPTNYGQLASRSFAAAWPGADVYLLNGGSMRLDDDIAGVVTAYDVLRTFPFGGSIVQLQVPGTVLMQVLQAGLVDNVGEGGYLQTHSVARAQGQWQVGGQPIDPARTYTLVLPAFVAEGKEKNLGFLAQYPATSQGTFSIGGRTVKNDVRDIVIDYMSQGGK